MELIFQKDRKAVCVCERGREGERAVTIVSYKLHLTHMLLNGGTILSDFSGLINKIELDKINQKDWDMLMYLLGCWTSPTIIPQHSLQCKY